MAVAAPAASVCVTIVAFGLRTKGGGAVGEGGEGEVVG